MIATTGAAIPNRVNNNNRLCQADRLCLVSIIRHEEETGEWRRGEARRELNGQKCSSLKSWPPFCFTSSQFYFFRFFLPVVDGRRPDNWNILRVSIYYQFSAVQLSFRVMTLTQWAGSPLLSHWLTCPTWPCKTGKNTRFDVSQWINQQSTLKRMKLTLWHATHAQEWASNQHLNGGNEHRFEWTNRGLTWRRTMMRLIGQISNGTRCAGPCGQ